MKHTVVIDRPVPIYRKIAKEVERAVDAGETKASVAARLNVSTTVVDHAYQHAKTGLDTTGIDAQRKRRDLIVPLYIVVPD